MLCPPSFKKVLGITSPWHDMIILWVIIPLNSMRLAGMTHSLSVVISPVSIAFGAGIQ